tara:strand:- start:101 stop:445 length:345 start_codon:yes stop_codon:yes gene_type:complete
MNAEVAFSRCSNLALADDFTPSTLHNFEVDMTSTKSQTDDESVLNEDIHGLGDEGPHITLLQYIRLRLKYRRLRLKAKMLRLKAIMLRLNTKRLKLKSKRLQRKAKRLKQNLKS